MITLTFNTQDAAALRRALTTALQHAMQSPSFVEDFTEDGQYQYFELMKRL